MKASWLCQPDDTARGLILYIMRVMGYWDMMTLVSSVGMLRPPHYMLFGNGQMSKAFVCSAQPRYWWAWLWAGTFVKWLHP